MEILIEVCYAEHLNSLLQFSYMIRDFKFLIQLNENET